MSERSHQTAPMLSPSVNQLHATYKREGWAHVPRLLDAAQVQALLAATLSLERAAAEFTQNTLVRGVFFEVQSQSGKKGEPAVFLSPPQIRWIG